MQIKQFKGQVIGMDQEVEQAQITTKERVYNFLVEYIQKNGYAPSIREICAGTYLSSTTSVYNHLLTLEDEGKIEMKRNSPRAIKLVGYEYRKVKG